MYQDICMVFMLSESVWIKKKKLEKKKKDES